MEFQKVSHGSEKLATGVEYPRSVVKKICFLGPNPWITFRNAH